MEVWRGLLVLLGLYLMMIGMQGRGSEARLVENFYRSSCPNVQAIVKQAVSTKLGQTPLTILGTLRLFYHDCFIEGSVVSQNCVSSMLDQEKGESLFRDRESIMGSLI